ncbi:MAG: flagellar filament capping protein FliD [Desulfobacterium sp.]|nr:flagellar filament capping protein FliD [Desulfobacterium sp.]
MGSGSVSTLGVGSGLDLQGILEKLRAVDQKAITNQETKKTELEEKIQEYNKINANLLSMKSTALNLSLGSGFLNRKISASGSSITATAVAGSGAKVMSHQMEVTALAAHSSWNSEGIAAKTDSVATTAGTFSFKLGETGSPLSIDVPAGTTLQDFANLINENDSNPGVTATIADTGFGDKPYRLVLTSNETGEDNRIFLESQLSGVGLTESEGASHTPPTSDNATAYSTTITSDNAVADPIAIAAGTNDEIVFRETLADGTLGPALTATIPALAAYTPEALATAMETAMEAASLTGGNEIDYTVSYESVTGKFSIQENGSDLQNLTMEWASSSAAADLGFDATTDTFDTIGIATGTNDEIVFRERLADGSLGGELTATIPPLTDYTPYSLADAMETAMEAASLAGGNEIDYTVTFDAESKKYSIVENGSDLYELSMEWGKSSAAATLGFNNETDSYKPYDSNLNARFTVDSISYQRQSNTEINDVIMGVNLDMTATGTTSINVANDLSETKTNLQKLVETLNSLKTEIDSKNTYDIAKQTKGLLFGENSITRITDDLSEFMGRSIITNSSVKNLFDLGFEINRDGSFALNETVLDSILASNPEGVQEFFIGDLDGENKGFGDLLNEKLRDYTGSDGLITTSKDESQKRIDRLAIDIVDDTKRLDKRYEIMAKQFVELDIYMREMTAQSDFLKQMFEPVTKK